MNRARLQTNPRRLPLRGEPPFLSLARAARPRLAHLLLLAAAVLAAQPDNPATVAADARRAMAEGRFAQAAELYGKLYPLAPDDFGMLVNLGMARSLAGRHAEAVEPLAKAVAKNAGAFPAQLFLGSSYFNLGRFDAAAKALEAAAKLNPQHAPARRMLGAAYAALERPGGALPHLEKLTALEPDSPGAWAALGKAYAALARQAFAALEAAAPESAYMLQLVGDIRFSAEQYPSAFYLYRQALEREPGRRGLHAAIAEIYRRTGRDAWADVEQAKEAALAAIDCATERFACLFAQGRLDELRRAAAGLDSAEGRYWTAQACNLLAERAFARLEGMPPSAAVHIARAEVHKEMRRFDAAAEQWAAALALQPADADLEAELAGALYQSRQFDKAEPRLRALLQKFPREAEWPFMLGDILLSRQQAEEAAPLLAKAVKLDPDLLPAHHALGRAYAQAGRDADAIPHLEKALPLDDDGSLLYQLAQAYRAGGDREAAAPLLERYRQIQTAQRRAAEEFRGDIRITAPDQAP